MRTNFIYILILLIVVILYEFYLVGFYKYQDFQINNYINSLEKSNADILARNLEKESNNLYIRTKAYQNFVLKATQNKKLPGEEIINIVEEADVTGNENIDVNAMIFQVKKAAESPTKGMTNPEKWWYLLGHMNEK
ncbi:hypothetical protein KBB25_02935 [Candidatus Gracilibacteria bacterium]|nr:hypothetical protein [Candidatus Gracilibacteria bacterium]